MKEFKIVQSRNKREGKYAGWCCGKYFRNSMLTVPRALAAHDSYLARRFKSSTIYSPFRAFIYVQARRVA